MTDKQKINIGNELKRLRLEQGLSLRKVAVLMGLGKDTTCSIERIEKGNFDCSKLAKRYFEVLGYKMYERYSYNIMKVDK